MQYISTRGQIEPISFTDAVMMGLATDGGLLLPATIPDVRDQLTSWRNLSYPDLAYAVMTHFVGDSIPPRDLRSLIDKSYASFSHPEVVPIVPVHGLRIMELFHGPTLAFKDVALQFLGNVFEYVLRRDHRQLNILGATSGDTGSAAIHGTRGRSGINIFILHPHGRVSPVQERQMTTVLDSNVHNLAIEGSFDDGQRIIKTLFADLEFKEKYQLGAVNSVNWCRVMAQIVYYFYAALQTTDSDHPTVRVCVPTGNFGNIFAGYIASRMGAPIERLVLATNENDILQRFFSTGIYSHGPVAETLSPSMDIQVASNFERYLYYYVGENSAKLCELMETFTRTGSITVTTTTPVDPLFESGVGDTEATLEAIRTVYDSDGYILDPHTAVGVAVAKQKPSPTRTVCLATAHPAKFSEAITRAIGKPVGNHPAIDQLAGRPTRSTVIPASRDAVQDYIENALSAN